MFWIASLDIQGVSNSAKNDPRSNFLEQDQISEVVSLSVGTQTEVFPEICIPGGTLVDTATQLKW